jgi:hypothetical protein
MKAYFCFAEFVPDRELNYLMKFQNDKGFEPVSANTFIK